MTATAEKLKPLNDQERRFVAEYLIDLDAERAGLAAGYSKTMARSKCFQWVSDSKQNPKPQIRAAVAEVLEKRLTKLELTSERVLAELAKAVFFDMDELLHITPSGDPYIDLSKASAATRGMLTQAEIEDFVDKRERDEGGNVVARDVRRVKIKGPDKLAAINTAMKHLGLLTERVEIAGLDGFAKALANGLKRAERSRG